MILDTHVLIWLRFGDDRLGARTRESLKRAWLSGDVAVSAVSFWEVAMLHEKGRLTLLQDIGSWRQALLQDGIVEIPVDGEIGIRAAGLVDFHADPADRLIVETALGGTSSSPPMRGSSIGPVRLAVCARLIERQQGCARPLCPAQASISISINKTSGYPALIR